MKKYILTFIIGGISFANILAASNGVYNITVSHEYIGIDAKHLTKATSTTTIDIRNAQGGDEKPFKVTTTDYYDSNKKTISRNIKHETTSNTNTWFRATTCTTKGYGYYLGDFEWDEQSFPIANDYLQLKPGVYDYFNTGDYKERVVNWWSMPITIIPIWCDVEYQVRPIIKISPKEITLDKNGAYCILFDDFVQDDGTSVYIEATQGFPAACYPWSYSTNGTSYTRIKKPITKNNGASLFPQGAALINASSNWSHQDSLTAYKTLVENTKNVHFNLDYHLDELKYMPDKSPTRVSVPIKLTAPRITQAHGFAPTCNERSDGHVVLVLNELIRSDDTLQFTVHEIEGNLIKDKAIDGVSFSYTTNSPAVYINGLKPGKYAIYYQGKNTSKTYGDYFVYIIKGDDYKIDNFPKSKACQKGHAVIVTVPDAPKPITATIEGTNLTCFESGDGAVTLQPAGGTAPYDLHVNGLDNPYTLATDTIQRPFSFQHLAAGRYAVDISDAHGCESYRDTVTLTQPDPLDFDFGHTELLKCYGDADGQLWLNRLEGGTPPYTVRWDWVDYNEKDSTLLQKRVNETQLLTDRLKAFRYALTVTDAHRCTRSSDTFAIHEPDEIKPSVSIRASNNVCPDDELDLATADAHGGTPPYEFIWKINDRFAYGENLSTLPFGKFRLSVRDANDCLVRREYTNEGPDTIRANARVIDVKCQGENTGAIELDPTGGTGDIQCRWTDAQGLEVTDLQHLAEGTYFLTMTDGLRCQAFDTAHVGTTSHIRFDHTAIQPSCYSLEDGALEVCARGGVEPYNWEGDCLRLEHIGRGMHPVSVTDAAGCVKDTLIELTAPESITPFLPERIALCINQAERNLRADTLAYPSATYVWTHDGDVTAEGPVCTVSRPGHYRLHMEYEGCTEDKDFEVQPLGDSIAAYFLVASFVPVDDDVRAVNLSRLPADKTEWLTSPNADIIRSDEREILLYFTEKGSAEIGLRTYKGACVAEYFQTLQIVDDDQVAAYDRFGSVVEQFTVSPNPSNGKFNVKVALNKAMSYTLTLLSGKNVMQTVSRNDSRGQIDAFQLEAVSGVYFIRLDIPDANIRQTRKIIVE